MKSEEFIEQRKKVQRYEHLRYIQKNLENTINGLDLDNDDIICNLTISTTRNDKVTINLVDLSKEKKCALRAKAILPTLVRELNEIMLQLEEEMENI